METKEFPQVENAKKIRLWYGIFLGVLTLAVAIAFIVQVADIYYGGPDPTGHNYSAESVQAHLVVPLVLMGVWAAAIVGGFVLSVVFPMQEKRLAASDNRKTLARLKRRMPAFGEGESFANAKKAVALQEKLRLGIWLGVLAVGVAAAIAILVYVFTPAHYATTDFNGNMLEMLKNVMPWVGAVLLLVVGATVFEHFSVKDEITHVKAMIAAGARTGAAGPQNAFGAPAEGTHKNRLFLTEKTKKIVVLVLRCVVGALAVAFIIAGAFNGGARDVWYKATKICMECIGLG